MREKGTGKVWEIDKINKNMMCILENLGKMIELGTYHVKLENGSMWEINRKYLIRDRSLFVNNLDWKNVSNDHRSKTNVKYLKRLEEYIKKTGYRSIQKRC